MAPATKQALRIDVISDTVCPWCFIGKRRLEQALAQRSDRYDFDVNFHPFELNPDLPPEGVEAQAHYAEKFGSWERFLEITQRVAGVGSELGIDFAFEKASRSPNTFESHRLVRLAAKAGKQSDVVEALFSAHFVEGRDVGDRETLVAIATEAGLDADEVRASLASDAGVEEVRGAEAEVRRLGVTSVPFFILEGKLAVSGAQPAEAFLQAIDQVAAQAD